MRRDGSLADWPAAAEATRGLPRCASPMWSITTRFSLGDDRLRDRGMLTKAEAAHRLGIHEATLVRLEILRDEALVFAIEEETDLAERLDVVFFGEFHHAGGCI